jgi:hypothetical protein
MPVCPICKVTFHSCSNCHHNNFWEYTFCSVKCWREGSEYKRYRAEFKALYSTINDAQKKMLMDLLMFSDDYLGEIDDWIESVEKKDENEVLC